MAPAPHIFNSDQGSQFTSLAYEQAPLAASCHISRDGRGRTREHVLIYRFADGLGWLRCMENIKRTGQRL